MKKIHICVLLTATLLVCFLCDSHMVNARSKETEANKAYAEILSNKKKAEGILQTGWWPESKGKFALIDIFYPNKKIYYSITGHASIDEIFYRFDGKKMTELARYNNSDERELKKNATYYIRKKKVSKEKYQQYVKKIKNGAKEQKITYYKNTAAKRNF